MQIPSKAGKCVKNMKSMHFTVDPAYSLTNAAKTTYLPRLKQNCALSKELLTPTHKRQNKAANHVYCSHFHLIAADPRILKIHKH